MPAYGDLVIIVTPKGKRSLRRVDENQDMHTQDGILRMADVVEAQFGSEVCTTLGVPYRIQKPTLNDIVKGVKRQTQILYPKDIGYILYASRRGAEPHGHRSGHRIGQPDRGPVVVLRHDRKGAYVRGQGGIPQARSEEPGVGRGGAERDHALSGHRGRLRRRDRRGRPVPRCADAVGLFEAHPRRRDARRCAGVPPAHRGSGRQAPPRAGAGALRRRRSLRNPRAPLEAHRGSPAPRRPHGRPYRVSHFRPPSGTLGEVGRMPHRVARHP